MSRRDTHYQRCVAELAALATPLLTCWPLMAEGFWLVRHSPEAFRGLFRGCADNLWTLAPMGPEALPWPEAFLNRYRKIGAQLPDACLVDLAERDGSGTVFTLDRRDFCVYRYGKNRPLKVIPAPRTDGRMLPSFNAATAKSAQK